MATVIAPLIEPDRQAIQAHLEALFAPARADYPDGLLEIRHGVDGALNKHAYFSLSEARIADAVHYAVEMNRMGQNVYVGVNPRKSATDTRRAAKDSDVEIAFFQFADLDKKESVDRLAGDYPLKATMVVVTGTVPNSRPHLYWQLEEPVGNMAAWTDRQRSIAHALGGDAVINPSRIMRLAGTVNFPSQDKVARGYKVELTALRTEFADERPPVSPEQIAFAYPPRSEPLTSHNDIENPISGQNTLQAMRSTRMGDLLAACRNGEQWHNNMVRLVAHMAAKGRTDAEILGLADNITLPGYNVQQTLREMSAALRSARTKWDLPEPQETIEDEEAARETADLNVVDAFDFEEADIPVRPWLVPGALLAGYTHMLAAPGGSGKSLFTLQFAIAIATGMQWGGFKPRRQYKSLIINVEDDIDEQRRRLAAAARVMNVEPRQLRGWIYLVDGSQGVVVAGHDPDKRSLVMTPVAVKLRQYIEQNRIDVLWADPFAETFEGDENDNSEVKWAMKIWRDEIARPTRSAVYLVHHTTKYAQNGAGDANVIRGAGAIVNSTRISATLMPMTTDEATAIGIEQAERHLYVRYDDAKANQSLKTNTAKWFRKESVELCNGHGLELPDEVGALVPWTPPDAFDGLSMNTIHMLLDKVEEGIIDSDGVVTGIRYTASTKGGSRESGRWFGDVLIELAGVSEAAAKKVIRTWLANGVLVEQGYHCPHRRKERNGLFAPLEKRPGEVK